MRFKRRGIYLALIGALIIVFAILFLQESIVSTRTYQGILEIPAHRGNYIDLNIQRNSNLTYTITYNCSSSELNVSLYLSSQEAASQKLIKMNNPYNGSIVGLKRPGEYYLVIYNNGEKNLTVNYSVRVSFIHMKEKFGAATSITGIILVLVGLLVLYNDIVSYYSRKYPDHIVNGPIECHSVKLHRHICTVDARGVPIDKIMDNIEKYMAEKDYKLKKKLIQGLIYERSRSNPLSKTKPAIVTVEYFQYPKITLTYVIPRSRAAGSIDLAWIYNEVAGLAERLGLSIPNRNNRDRVYPDQRGYEEESRVKREDEKPG
jgi:hypothetical protein